MMRIGIDTGGTFTDFVVFDEGTLSTFKLPSTPHNPAEAILEGLKPYMDRKFELIHGTTVSTNAFLQKKIAPTAFICTQGFEHILYIGRQNRTGLFSLEVKKPSPIVPLSLCFGIPERTLKDGTIEKKVDEPEIEKTAALLKQQNITSVGIVFLHSYLNSQNEQIAADIFRKNGFYVTASHEIIPEYREYERAVVTVLNAALQPVIAQYVNNLKDALSEKKFSIIQSNGGILSPHRVIREPIHTLISGPAGGIIAAQQIARLTGILNLVTLDMGGTSTDVSIIKQGEISLTRQGFIEHLPLHFPIVDIVTVGAGGGSIARIDKGGVLQVGPESAGADPGPVCYGKSEIPTITDAFAVTGAILPETFLGGKMKISPKRSVNAIKQIAQQIGKNLFETAEGIIRISISTMERALRSVTLEKGEDPRLYTLLPFGGAGGLVAAMLAEKLGINRILIPPYQGVFSALGMLMADYKKELSQSFLEMYSPEIIGEMDKAFYFLEKEVIGILKEDGYPGSAVYKSVDMRYKGQSYELAVPYEFGFLSIFHQLHHLLYSYSLDDSRCEIVNLRVLGVGKNPEIILEKKKMAENSEAKVYFRKEIYFNGEFQQFNIYNRIELMPGQRLISPALVVSDDATVIIPKGYRAEVDPFSNILMDTQSTGYNNR